MSNHMFVITFDGSPIVCFEWSDPLPCQPCILLDNYAKEYEIERMKLGYRKVSIIPIPFEEDK